MPRINRTTSEQLIHLLLERVQEIDSSPFILSRVDFLLIFGSYLSHCDKIDAIDVCVMTADKKGNALALCPGVIQERYQLARKAHEAGEIDYQPVRLKLTKERVPDPGWDELILRQHLSQHNHDLSFYEQEVFEMSELPMLLIFDRYKGGIIKPASYTNIEFLNYLFELVKDNKLLKVL